MKSFTKRRRFFYIKLYNIYIFLFSIFFFFIIFQFYFYNKFNKKYNLMKNNSTENIKSITYSNKRNQIVII